MDALVRVSTFLGVLTVMLLWEEFRPRRSQAAPPLVVDVRSPEEFVGALGHIDGALSLPLPELKGRLGELAPHRGRPMVTV